MKSAILSQADLAALVQRLVAAGTRVIAPATPPDDPKRTEYRPVQRLDEAALRQAIPAMVTAMQQVTGAANESSKAAGDIADEQGKLLAWSFVHARIEGGTAAAELP